MYYWSVCGTKVYYSHSVLKVCVQFCGGYPFISIQHNFICTFLTITPKILPLSSVDQTSQSCAVFHTLLPQGWHVPLLLSYMPGTVSCFTDTWFTCLATCCKITPLSVPPHVWRKHMHALTVRVKGMWLKHNNSFYPSYGWCAPLLILCPRFF